MKKRLLVLGIAAVLLGAAILLPHMHSDVRAVVHQHRSFPAENPELTGFQSDGSLRSHLPLLLIHTDGAPIPGQDRKDPEKLRCRYEIMDSRTEVNSTDGTPVLSGMLDLSIRGNSSRNFPKKQYSVKLRDGDGLPQKQPLLGMPAQSSWVLNGSYLDQSMIRDYVLYNLSGEIMEGYTPRCRLCEVVFTDASGAMCYQGVYTLIEKISVCEERLNLEPYDPAFPETSFLVQMNNHTDHFCIWHLKPKEFPVYPFDLEYPRLEDLSAGSLSYIQRELLVFEKMLHDASMTRDWSKAEQRIDLDSFVDYFLINEFFQNYDAGHRSTFLYQNLDGKISIGPVWDFDGSFNNYDSISFDVTQVEMPETLYYQYLMHNPDFVRRCIRRYTQLRQGVLSEESLLSYLQEASGYLGTAAERNCARWYGGDTGQAQAELEKMMEYVRTRGQWFDRHIEETSRSFG